MTLNKIEEQKIQWSLKSEDEKNNFLEECEKKNERWKLNFKILFIIIFVLQILLVLTLKILGFDYNLF